MIFKVRWYPPKVSRTESSKIQLENKEHTFALDSEQECHSYPPCLPAQLASLFPPLGLETMQQASTCAGVVEKKSGYSLSHKVSS